MSKAKNRIIIAIGETINSCVYLGDEPNSVDKTGKIRRRSKFKCRCGNEFVCNFHSVKRGLTSSCGCVHKKLASSANITHGLTGNKLSGYNIWQTMIQRCTNKNSTSYYMYGAVGIFVCNHWLSFDRFHMDMGDRPSMNHSIDRYPNRNGNYEPGNCRWATLKQQANNKKDNIYIEHGGEIKTLKEWCDLYNIKYKQAHFKFKKEKWSFERIINYPKLKVA